MHCEQALVLHQEIDDRHAQAGTYDSIAFAHRNLGHHEQAIASYEKALQLYVETGDSYYQAEIFRHLGGAHDDAGDCGSARNVRERALAILDDLGHPDADQVRTQLAELRT